jgi:diguanylate cyclase (GGDEF)-like protein
MITAMGWLSEEHDVEGSDRLTGLKNRRHLHVTLDREVARAHRERRRLSLVLLDIDNFKRINDEAGHPTGDNALKLLAERLVAVARPSDSAYRLGGDEFAVILPESSLRDANQFSLQLNNELAGHPIPALRTLSYGTAELAPGEDSISFLRRADLRLWEGKQRPPESLGVREPRRPSPSGGSAPVGKPVGDGESSGGREECMSLKRSRRQEVVVSANRLDRIPWERDDVQFLRDRLDEIEQELAEVKRELAAKTRKLEVAEHQVSDLKGLIKLRKVPVRPGAPEIYQYYRD